MSKLVKLLKKQINSISNQM